MEVVSDAASRKVLIGEDPQQHLRPVKRYEGEVGGGGERGGEGGEERGEGRGGEERGEGRGGRREGREGRREGRGRLRYVERNSWYRSLSIL